jgi:cell fate regulator YaaT (PSP1 superfamily)
MSLKEYLEQLPEDTSHQGCGRCGMGNGSSAAEGEPTTEVTATAVRFGYMRYIGEFTHPPDLRFAPGGKVIIQTKRGIELGQQVSLTCSACEQAVSRDRITAWVEQCGHDSFVFEAGRILREATAADLAEYARIQAGCREKVEFCQRVADRHKLPIHVVECECPFGGERIIFYFTAAERVDFRAVVRELAREYRTRIEMRQIGARDEARLLADYETCGREVCCKTFLKTLQPISMRMAKLQKATLDPSQVSGRCGRLKCCLRYEHVGYEELDKRLPKVGVRVRWSQGEGVVVNRQVLTQLVQIRKDVEDALVIIAFEDISAVNVPPPTAERTAAERAAKSAPTETAPAKERTGRKPKPARGKPVRRENAAAESSDAAEAREKPEEAAPQGEKTDDQASRRRRRGRRRRPRRRRGGPQRGSGSGSSPEAGE